MRSYPERFTQHLSGSDQLNQHYVNSFGKRFRVMDVCLYEKSPALQV